MSSGNSSADPTSPPSQGAPAGAVTMPTVPASAGNIPADQVSPSSNGWLARKLSFMGKLFQDHPWLLDIIKSNSFAVIMGVFVALIAGAGVLYTYVIPQLAKLQDKIAELRVASGKVETQQDILSEKIKDFNEKLKLSQTEVSKSVDNAGTLLAQSRLSQDTIEIENRRLSETFKQLTLKNNQLQQRVALFDPQLGNLDNLARVVSQPNVVASINSIADTQAKIESLSRSLKVHPYKFQVRTDGSTIDGVVPQNVFNQGDNVFNHGDKPPSYDKLGPNDSDPRSSDVDILYERLIDSVKNPLAAWATIYSEVQFPIECNVRIDREKKIITLVSLRQFRIEPSERRGGNPYMRELHLYIVSAE